MIATKLYFPFHTLKEPHKACSLSDPAALNLDWEAWLAAQSQRDDDLNSKDSLPRGSEIHITENDVMDMSSSQLDQYMDYYERTFVDESRAETKPRGLPKELLDMFPTNRTDGSSPTPYNYAEQAEKERVSTDEALKSVVGSLSVRPVAPEDDETADRIGSKYRRYRNLENMEETARVFHAKVADLVGIKVQTLAVAVAQLERRLMVYREAQVRKARDEDVETGASATVEGLEGDMQGMGFDDLD